MLWFLHLCSVNKIVVTTYSDNVEGEMIEKSDGSGQFASVTLKPQIEVTEEWMIKKSEALHDEANQKCFIANSVNFPVKHEVVTRVGK